MRPTDLNLLRTVQDPQLAPDGDRVAYVVGSIDTDADEATSRVHVLDLGSSQDRVFTAGPADASPRWSPDGQQIAFLRSGRREDKPQVAMVAADGGEARVLTEMPLGVSELIWTPDGTQLVLVAAAWRADVAELDDDARATHPRRILDRAYRADGLGWVHDRVSRVWLLDLDGDAVGPVAITPADASAHGIAVTADGAYVVFVSARQDDAELSPAAGVWRVPLAGGEPEELVAPGQWSSLSPQSDGSVLLVGLLDAESWPAPSAAYRLRADGVLQQLAPMMDRGTAGGPQLVVTPGGVLCLVEDRGAVELRRLAGGSHQTLVGGAQMVTHFSATDDGSRVVYAATHPTDPGELWLLQDGESRVLTGHNADLREHLLPVEHFTFERDGAQIDAWGVLPVESDGAPLLVNIHGGPTAQYGYEFLDEFQVEAGAGYAVVGCNPRGSSGRGAAWSTAVVGVWHDEGSVDTLDLEAVADAMLARHPQLDTDRVGIMGGSYGGYTTARLLARTDRYRSAIVERGLLAWPSFAGTSDIGAYFDRMFLGTSMPGDVDAQWAASPVRTAEKITTPTLVLHSLEDHRCPPEQAYQLFSILRRNGVTSEMLLFPDEGHELSRSGSPRHRLQRFEAVLEWHDRHLRP
jgi:dipeptidyl aminopeptidase/acylaminoacyl peptidase